MGHLLGIDLGTSGTKAILVDRDGRVRGKGRREYGIDVPRPGWAEQNPDTWLRAAAGAVQEAVAEAGISPADVTAIGLSGQMHTAVLLDQEGSLLRPAILWADQRSRGQVAEAYRLLGHDRLARWTLNPLATGFTLATLLWLQDNEPTLYSRIGHVLLPKDYLRYHLTGEIATEPTDASATSLMDVAHQTWNVELLDMCRISPAALPPVRGTAEIAGRLCAQAAAELGLIQGIPVVHGSGDQAAQAVGNAVIRPGLISCTIGTGGQILAPSVEPVFDPELRLHTYCHAVPGEWFVMAAILSAGLSLSWWRRLTSGQETYADLADAAAQVPTGAEGLSFLPYLTGERTPHMDPAARGAFVGLTLRHERAHLTRAILEGVVFALRQGLELIRELGVPVTQVVASGGGARHPLWLQLQANILKCPVVQTGTEEAAAYGAALLAGVGAGVYSDIATACERTVRLAPPPASSLPNVGNEPASANLRQSGAALDPDPEQAAAYDILYRRWTELYPALRPYFHTQPSEEQGLQ